MLTDLLEIFQTKIKALEVLFVLEGVKPVARIMTLDDRDILAFCAKNNLSVQEADFKVKMLDEDKQYSNKGIILDKYKEGYKVLYISKDIIKADQAKQLESNKKHYELGLILGYPECCCSFFETNSEKEEEKNNDFILAITNNTKEIDNSIYTNVFTTYFDHALISHFPHSFDCEESIKLAKRHFEIIKKHSEDIANNYIKMLKSIAIYTPLGVYILYGEIDKHVIKPVKILANQKNDLYNLLYNSKTVEIVDKNGISINKNTLRNKNMAVINFCKE